MNNSKSYKPFTRSSTHHVNSCTSPRVFEVSHCTGILTRPAKTSKVQQDIPVTSSHSGLGFQLQSVKTMTPTVYGSVFYVRALNEAQRILKINHISINWMITFWHKYTNVILLQPNDRKIDPEVCLNKTCTNCHI